MFSTLAIVITLLLLMFFAYRGYSVLILAPIMATLAVLLSGDFLSSIPAYTDVFMGALSGFLLKFFPIFLLGALFGRLMADSGAASAIANTVVKKLGASKAILAVILVCAILTYGGVSLFVVAFAIYPIAKDLFKAADIPKRLIPAAIALGSFTFTMTALPGTPAIQNAIPIPYYNTNVFAAPILGIIGGTVMFIGGWMWLQSRARKANAAGEGYGQHDEEDVGGVGAAAKETEALNTHHTSFTVAMIPLVLVIGLNAVLTYAIFPSMDFSALQTQFPDLNIAGSLGLWSIIISLIVACVVLILLRIGHWNNLQKTINRGTYDSMLPIFNTASEVGYGAVIASLAGFLIIRDSILNLNPDNPLISEAVAMTTLAGITGSASGGLSIALSTLGEDYLRMAVNAGIDPELMHRVAVMAAGGLDTLPHSGAVITLLAICGLTHKQSYLNLAMVTMIIPLVAMVAVIILGTMFGSF
ncbi:MULTISPECIES: GntP family permease [unclassified Psychrobacter]|uniref:GntP family permease n=1 Tax=unclassified Psychrobacter TaxID=196806 RepID=UPI0025B30EBD|nr:MULTISPECIES: GntP family permease [unclassified Psychrobacter]MDN3452462.1 GntP family permease [Psychrobacter sp. APC 3350]MDN3503035.1 GntP family permease [Psychrobacter sp. 5A.1]